MTQKLEFFWLWIIFQVSNFETSFLEDYGELGEILDIPNRSRSFFSFWGSKNRFYQTFNRSFNITFNTFNKSEEISTDRNSRENDPSVFLSQSARSWWISPTES